MEEQRCREMILPSHILKWLLFLKSNGGNGSSKLLQAKSKTPFQGHPSTPSHPPMPGQRKGSIQKKERITSSLHNIVTQLQHSPTLLGVEIREQVHNQTSSSLPNKKAAESVHPRPEGRNEHPVPGQRPCWIKTHHGESTFRNEFKSELEQRHTDRHTKNTTRERKSISIQFQFKCALLA